MSLIRAVQRAITAMLEKTQQRRRKRSGDKK